MNLKKKMALSLTVVLALGTVAPVYAEEAPKEIKIGLAQINNTNSYYIGASKAFNEAADYFGYTLDEQYCENSLE